MECASAFRSFADGRVNELTRGIVPPDAEGFVIRALACDVCARVRQVAQRAIVCKRVAISLVEFAIVQLAIYEFEEGGAFLILRSEFSVYSAAHCL